MQSGESDWQWSLGNPVNRIFGPSRTKQPAGGDEETFVKPVVAHIASIECSSSRPIMPLSNALHPFVIKSERGTKIAERQI
jgi:hypothetical protein